jgi:delta1-piperideine-2-carboxylate reductase
METLITAIHDAGQDRLPGDRRYANRRESMLHGIVIPASELERLRALAA